MPHDPLHEAVEPQFEHAFAPGPLRVGIEASAERQKRNHQRRGDDQDPHLARLFPRFDDLAAAPRFEAVTATLYGPFAEWLCTLRIDPLPDAVVADDDDEAADD